MPRFKIDAWLARQETAVAIVGATGWVGRAMLDAVLTAAPDLPPERLRLFASARRPLAMAGRAFETAPLDQTSSLGPGRWLIVHAGVVGGDATPGGAVRVRNDALLDQVLRVGAEAQVERLVLISSGAAGFGDKAPAAKAAYARMKRDHERMAETWSRQTGLCLLIPRIFNLGGPYMTCAENYALGDFILRLSRDGRVAIAAADPVVRSYVHVLEMAGVLLDMAVDKTEDGAPFDIDGGQVIELGELAHEVARALGLTDAQITRPAPSGGAGDLYVGDGARYQAALAKTGRGVAPLPAIIADTIAYLRPNPA